jgi:hypothetical protein
MCQSGGTVTLNDDALTRRKHPRFDNPAKEPTSPDHGVLEIRTDRVQHITRLADGCELNHYAALKTEPVADGKPLNVDTLHRDVLAHDTRPDGITFGAELLDQLEILNRDATVRAAVFLVVMAVAGKTVRRDFGPVDRPLRYAAG